MKIMCPISIGELIDRFAILEIKSRKMPVNKSVVCKELDELHILHGSILDKYKLQFLKLLEINSELWDVLTLQRKLIDRAPDVVRADISLKVQTLNDKRFEIKSSLNEESEVKELKHYVVSPSKH